MYIFGAMSLLRVERAVGGLLNYLLRLDWLATINTFLDDDPRRVHRSPAGIGPGAQPPQGHGGIKAIA
jgi:hypothetical protein